MPRKLTNRQIHKVATEFDLAARVSEILDNDPYTWRNPSSTRPEWAVLTPAGVLKVSLGHLWGDPPRLERGPADTIFCRFEEPARASSRCACNPYSGKWNFHSFISRVHGHRDVDKIRRGLENCLDRFTTGLRRVREGGQ